MNDTTKANIQSVIRAGLNVFAGMHLLNADQTTRYEGIAAAAFAVGWTVYDNYKKSKIKIPPLSITSTLG